MSYELYLNFHVLGVLLLLSPLIRDVCQIIINTYIRLRAESRGSHSSLADSTLDKGPLSEADVVNEKEQGLRSGWAERTVKPDGGEKGLGASGGPRLDQWPVTPPPLLTSLDPSLDLSTESIGTPFGSASSGNSAFR